MKTIVAALENHSCVSHFKVNMHNKESYELFFVKGKLETVRCTNTCDKEVTIYVEHDGFTGDAQFFVYPSTTPEQLNCLIDEAVSKALLIQNPHYDLPPQETGDYAVGSNFTDYTPADLAAKIANAVFSANTVKNGSLNSVEVFVNRHTETVQNSNGLYKIQKRYDAMVEAIPTFNGETQSVELYEQYNFSSFDENQLKQEIAEKMDAVRARYQASALKISNPCKIILNKLELSTLFESIVRNLNYSSVYTHTNLFSKGDMIQSAPQGDKFTIWMAGEVTGNISSSKFDSDGLSLGKIRLVSSGKAENYYGSNRYGQYLGEVPTGNLGCMCVESGSASAEDLANSPYLEVISMSGLQVDFYNNYIGGEVRLAYYHNGTEIVPVTGISITGKLQDVLNTILLSSKTAVYDNYVGPEKAILTQMEIF